MDLSQQRYTFKIIDNEFLEATFSNRMKLLLNLNNISLQKSMMNENHFVIKDDYFYLELDYNLNDNFKVEKINLFILKMCEFVSQ